AGSGTNNNNTQLFQILYLCNKKMPGRGRAFVKTEVVSLRQPGHCTTVALPIVKDDEKDTCKLKRLLDRIINIKSPDDLQVQEVASEAKTLITKDEDLRWFVDELCSYGYKDRVLTSVVAKLFGLIAHHQAGECKLLTVLMRRVQDEYNKRLDLVAEDRYRFVTSALFLGE
ncbi:hypothetical protein OTU49_002672, partial [Cherax quadricarinatus]